jgi:hypothetical protein
MNPEQGGPTNPDDLLSDDEFQAKYHSFGGGAFGHSPVPGQEASPVYLRLEAIKAKREEEMNRSRIPAAPPEPSNGEIIPDAPTYLRNAEGQYVDPANGEPVRKGSPAWQELASRNQLPRNQ